MFLSALCPCFALHQAQQFCRAPSDACLMPWAHRDAQRVGRWVSCTATFTLGAEVPCGGLGSLAWLPALASALTNLQEPTRRGPVSDPRKDFLRASSPYAHHSGRGTGRLRAASHGPPRPHDSKRQRGAWWLGQTKNRDLASTTEEGAAA